MTLQQFKKKVVRTNWYDKYFYYLLFLAATIGGLFFLYDVIVYSEKYDQHQTRYLGYLAFLFLTTLGVSGLYFVPNRYKIITIISTLSTEKKKDIINGVVKEFGNPYCDNENDFYSFTYDKNLWSSNYKIYLSFDVSNFYASVQSVTRSYIGAGIIDFGGTERVRRKVLSSLTKLAIG